VEMLKLDIDARLFEIAELLGEHDRQEIELRRRTGHRDGDGFVFLCESGKRDGDQRNDGSKQTHGLVLKSCSKHSPSTAHSNRRDSSPLLFVRRGGRLPFPFPSHTRGERSAERRTSQSAPCGAARRVTGTRASRRSTAAISY